MHRLLVVEHRLLSAACPADEGGIPESNNLKQVQQVL